MRKDMPGLERRRLQRLRREYAKKGYQVLVEPRGEELPSPFAAFEPDLIAISDADKVVVEIRSKASIEGATAQAELADAVDRSPGWRFELVLTNPQSDLQEEASLDELEAALRSVDAVRRVSEPAAFLILWPAVESLLRRHLSDAPENEATELSTLIKTAYSVGILSKPHLDLLEETRKEREALDHGFRFH
ncbi:MAG: hypothetical protein AAFU79_29700, partial [Myxococcota bacterium]